MTGKDLVLFLINNDLLNKEIGSKVSDLFLSTSEAAVKLGISTTSMNDMVKLGIISHIEIDGVTYVSDHIDLTKLKRRKYE